MTLNVSASDGSGAGGVMMRFNNEAAGLGSANWQNYATTFPWTLPSGDGTKTVYAQFKDALGNTTTAEIKDSIGLDTSKPIASAAASPATWTRTRSPSP